MLSDAVTFLHGAAASRGSAVSYYTFHNGWCYARNSAILAAYPCPSLQGTFGLTASQLEAALSRFPKEPEITSTDDGSLVLKAGRLRATLVPVFVEPPEEVNVITWQQVPAGFVDALRTIAPFLAKEGTWHRSVRLIGATLTALNQRTAIEVTIDGMDATEALVSDEFVDYLIRLAAPPVDMSIALGAILCRWPNGAWAKAQLLNYEWPAHTDKIFNLGEAPIAITEEWRDAFKDAAALSEGHIVVCPEGLRGRMNTMNVDIEFATGVSNTSKWSIEVLEPMFKVADRWNPDREHSACFYGKNLRGVVATLR